ncbi:hypothetical protein ZIOFF_021554 [Zingiber officinale]|uniref:BURP domain-containing protein n=1 Tax=Zingiber officinale TaxID=94328 RepID=A0A8J5H9Y4_ZINOF|nr:hypothetical protein ZIOFF_021554 [Zingiber officinale]
MRCRDVVVRDPREVEATLGRSLTFAEDIWFRYTARMPDYLLFYHNIIFLFIIFSLAPLPLTLIELGFPASVSSFKIQPKIRLPPTSFFQCYKDVMRVFLLIVGPLQLSSYPHHQVCGDKDWASPSLTVGSGFATLGLLRGGGLWQLLDSPTNALQMGLQKTNDEQYRRIQKTEHAPQVVEEELLRVQLEATAKSKELSQAHGAWFPPWLATHANYYKELATTHWKEHGQPVLDVLLQKVSEKSIQAQQFMEPHFESSKAKWMFLVSSTEPYVQTVSSKAVEVYHTSKSAMSSHIAKVQEISDPYFLAAKRFSQPYVKQFATITKPHVEKVRVAFSPYSDCVIHAYGKFLESATTYHQQLRTSRQLRKYSGTWWRGSKGYGSRVEAIVVCHLDTTSWNPQHVMLQVLQVKPGSAEPVCHILPSDHVRCTPRQQMM